jgi:hypothetical protein
LKNEIGIIGSVLLVSAALASTACSASSSGGANAAGSGGSNAAGSGVATGGSAGASAGTGGTTANGGTAGAGGSTGGSGGQTTGGSGGATAGAGGSTGGSGGKTTGGSGGTTAGAGGTSSGGSAGTSAGGSSAGGSGGGGTVKPILCPETDALKPKNPNTVLVLDNNLTADEHWTADKVYVISVPQGFGNGLDLDGHTLTIDAGTVICLDANNHLGVGTFGSAEIHVNGTADKPVIITAMPSASDPTKPDAFHSGVVFDSFKASTVSNLQVFYGGLGGGSGGWALRIANTAHGVGATDVLKLDHVTLDQVQVRGLYVGTPLGVDPTSTIHLGGFAPFNSSGPALDAVAQIDFMAGKSLGASFTIDVAKVPADAAHIDLRTAAANVDGAAELFDFGVPYRYHDVLSIAGPTGASLTLHEGVTLGLDSVLTIGDGGTDQKGDLVVLGSAAKPVVLTSKEATPAAQDWGGIFFVNGEFTAKSKIDNAKILYAGFVPPTGTAVGYCGDAGTGSIMIEGPTDGSAFTGPTITNTFIAHSAVDGIVAGANVAGSHVTTDYNKPDITFSDIAGIKVHTAPCP